MVVATARGTQLHTSVQGESIVELLGVLMQLCVKNATVAKLMTRKSLYDFERG